MPLRERVDTNQLRETVDLVALVGKHVVLRRRGGLYVGLCPFHNEKTPSFYVYPNQRYHCFGCGVDGDAIEFVKAIDGVDFKEAAKRLGAGTITAASYREHIEKRRAAAVLEAEAEVAAFPWRHMEALWEAKTGAELAAWRAENNPTLTDFERWLLLRWLREVRSEAFQNSVDYEYLRGEWERGR